jgi:hypothetical protein
MKAKDIFFYSIGALFIIGFFLCLGLVIFKAFPQENSAIINVMFGCLIAGVSTVLNYFYGSSKGSSDKTEMMNKTNGNGTT